MNIRVPAGKYVVLSMFASKVSDLLLVLADCGFGPNGGVTFQSQINNKTPFGVPTCDLLVCVWEKDFDDFVGWARSQNHEVVGVYTQDNYVKGHWRPEKEE